MSPTGRPDAGNAVLPADVCFYGGTVQRTWTYFFDHSPGATERAAGVRR